ncbi:hypothetical protein T439DRAFT_359968 [Meredithblackwellia eburnea MCA 4105]
MHRGNGTSVLPESADEGIELSEWKADEMNLRHPVGLVECVKEWFERAMVRIDDAKKPSLNKLDLALERERARQVQASRSDGTGVCTVEAWTIKAFSHPVRLRDKISTTWVYKAGEQTKMEWIGDWGVDRAARSVTPLGWTLPKKKEWRQEQQWTRSGAVLEVAEGKWIKGGEAFEPQEGGAREFVVLLGGDDEPSKKDLEEARLVALQAKNEEAGVQANVQACSPFSASE